MKKQANNQNSEFSNKNTSLSSILISSIKDGGIEDIGLDIAEIGIDAILDEGIFQELPIVKTIVSFTKTGLMIRDRLFIKKILLFLRELDEMPEEKKKEVVKNIQSNKDYAETVGETLIILLEKFDEVEKSRLLARLFSSYIRKVISFEEFLRYSIGVSNVLLQDIKDLLSYYRDEKDEHIVFWEGLFQGGFSSIRTHKFNIQGVKELILLTKYEPNFSAERLAQAILDTSFVKKGN